MEQNQTVTLNILLTSDIHGTVYPIHYQDNSPAELGLAKISTLIKKERSQNRNVLLIDNGDFIQGTPFTYHYVTYEKNKKNPMSLLANYLQYDAAIIGNHEFNYGMDILNNAVTTANFPYLSANILDKNSKKPYFGKPYIIKQIESNIKIAILGVTTHYIPNWEQSHHIKDLLFEDALKTTKEWDIPVIIAFVISPAVSFIPSNGTPEKAHAYTTVSAIKIIQRYILGFFGFCTIIVVLFIIVSPATMY